MKGIGLEYEESSKIIYNFKKFGKNKFKIKRMIDDFKKNNGCSDVVAMSASSGKLNNLQRLYGIKIRRLMRVCPKKDTHDDKLSNKNINSIKIYFDKIQDGRILLIDDICNSGQTLKFFSSLFKNNNIDTICLTLGISSKNRDSVSGSEEPYI